MFVAIASAAVLAATVAAQGPGQAIVINKCEYDVHVCNVPASGGGYSEIDNILSPNDTYSQTWTELTNGNGWSIKLSKSAVLDNILQYEYTWHNDGNIWYDLSEVNGNPWDANWEITAESPDDSCAPKQQAYRYATDDAYGMQRCDQDATITVTLCSGESQDDGAAASASSSVAALTSTQAAATSASAYSSATSAASETTTEAPESTSAAPETTSAAPETTSEESAPASTTATSSRQWTHHSWHQNDVASPTTFATLTTSSAVVTAQQAGVTVTEVDTAVVTEVVTAYGRHRRHNHAHARA